MTDISKYRYYDWSKIKWRRGELAGQLYLFLGTNYNVNPSGNGLPKLIPGFSLYITIGILGFSIISLVGSKIKRR